MVRQRRGAGPHLCREPPKRNVLRHQPSGAPKGPRMRIALVAPPFINIPPSRYGGTELFIAQLAEGLRDRGVDVVVYCNGESTVGVERKWVYAKSEWPIKGEIYDNLKDLNHSGWPMRDAAGKCDLIHVNNVPGLLYSRFVSEPVVYTMHHPHVPELSNVFEYFPQAQYVTISDFQRAQERMPKMRTIHHGIDFNQYRSSESKREHLAFIGRIAPVKGVHLAIEVVKKSGVPLKIAGEVQPMFQEYFDREVKPHLDGKLIEYVGPLGMKDKNDFLARAKALVFPIQWDEPFGLVMIEAMACGAPVLALPGGSVPEIVREGVSGYVCRDVEEMVQRVRELNLAPAAVRAYAEQEFSLARMVDAHHQLYARLIAEGGGSRAKNSASGKAVA